jgi:hypothetical protein
MEKIVEMHGWTRRKLVPTENTVLRRTANPIA